MVDHEDQCFEVDSNGKLIKIYYSVHDTCLFGEKKKVASVDLERTQAENPHSLLSFSAVCDIASILILLDKELDTTHDV